MNSCVKRTNKEQRCGVERRDRLHKIFSPFPDILRPFSRLLRAHVLEQAQVVFGGWVADLDLLWPSRRLTRNNKSK